MAMDNATSVNLLPCRIFDGNGGVVWIRWYRTADDAPAYPYWHAFAYPLYERDPDSPIGPGMLWEDRVHRPSIYPAAPTSYTPIGTKEDFRLGLLFPAMPELEGCSGPGIEAEGGICVCGGAWFRPIVGGGLPALARPPRPLYVSTSSVTAGAVVTAAHVEEPALRVVIGGGVPSLVVPPFPHYIATSTVIGGAVPSTAHAVSGGAYSDDYSDAWDNGP